MADDPRLIVTEYVVFVELREKGAMAAVGTVVCQTNPSLVGISGVPDPGYALHIAFDGQVEGMIINPTAATAPPVAARKPSAYSANETAAAGEVHQARTLRQARDSSAAKVRSCGVASIARPPAARPLPAGTRGSSGL